MVNESQLKKVQMKPPHDYVLALFFPRKTMSNLKLSTKTINSVYDFGKMWLKSAI